MDRLDELESESIYILREAYCKLGKLGILWSGAAVKTFLSSSSNDSDSKTKPTISSLVNGRGFGVKVNSAESFARFLKEFAAFENSRDLK